MVVDKVHPPFLIKEVNVTTELLTMLEGVAELLNNLCLCISKLIWITWVNRWEVCILEWIGLPIR